MNYLKIFLVEYVSTILGKIYGIKIKTKQGKIGQDQETLRSSFYFWKREWALGYFSTYNQFHNILRLFDVLPNFPFLQVNRCAIITYKNVIYELPHELPNDLRLKISGKCLNVI